MLEPFDEGLKITMINMLKGLMEKVVSMQDQMDNFSKDVKIIRKN